MECSTMYCLHHHNQNPTALAPQKYMTNHRYPLKIVKNSQYQKSKCQSLNKIVQFKRLNFEHPKKVRTPRTRFVPSLLLIHKQDPSFSESGVYFSFVIGIYVAITSLAQWSQHSTNSPSLTDFIEIWKPPNIFKLKLHEIMM